MKNICLNWTIAVLTGLFALFFITNIGFIFKISVNAIYLPVAMLIFIVVLAFLVLKDSKKNSLKLILAQLIVLFDLLIFAGIFCYFLPDFSYDGTTYHQAMIILLKWGLNPIWNDVFDFANRQEYVFSSSIEYVENFLKFFEIVGANIYLFFNKIELTKITNFIFMFCALCYSFYTLRNYEFSKIKSSAFAFLLIYNPVCICQMLTNYVDGAFYYMFLILLFACVNYVKRVDTNKNLYLVCISAVILSNLKLTGLFTTGIILIVFLCLYFSKKFLTTCLIAFLLILINGINPYFTNISKGRNIFYPIIKTSVFEANKDRMITSYPQGFENKNRFEKFFFSLFAVSKNLSPLIKSDDVPRLKIPFTINGDDRFIFEDMRLAGMGHLFSGILICSLMLLLFVKFKNREDKKLFWIIIAILIISILGNHEAWWARFVPQLWMLPVFILIFVSNKKLHFILLLYTVCILNCLIINTQYIENLVRNRNNYINYINQLPKEYFVPADYPVNFHIFETYPVKLQEYGIKVIYFSK